MVTSRTTWTPACRLIAARLPRIDIFERVTEPGDLAAIIELEALTNPRLRPMVGAISTIAERDRVTGPGSTYVMAPFAYPQSARFSDSSAGAYYAAHDLATAIAEVRFHRTRFAERTATPPMDFDERIIEAEVDGDFVDLRGEPASSWLYDPNPDSYATTQAFARRERSRGASGIVYRSVRKADGECIAVFIPRLVQNARTAGYIGLRWDGKRITDAYRKTSLTSEYP
jgi:hypothetical protein